MDHANSAAVDNRHVLWSAHQELNRHQGRGKMGHCVLPHQTQGSDCGSDTVGSLKFNAEFRIMTIILRVRSHQFCVAAIQAAWRALPLEAHHFYT